MAFMWDRHINSPVNLLITKWIIKSAARELKGLEYRGLERVLYRKVYPKEFSFQWAL